MFRRVLKDESGIALGLAVIMIVLIGVMGAGLLVFVRNDLEAVVEVNQGQRALEAASAGVQAAENHLSLEDNSKESYDGDVAVADTEWSYVNPGKDLNFDGDTAEVTIRYLEPSTTESEARQENNAPEVDASGTYDNNRKYFKIMSRGEAGETARLVEAIYRTTDFEFPAAYYATKNIDFNGNSTTLDSVSLFAGGLVERVRPENITGTDLAYGDWTDDPDGGPNDYNATPRSTANAGVGALGSVDYDPSAEESAQKSNSGSPQRYGVRDFDADSDVLVSSEEFVENTWGDLASQPVDDITFPFPVGNPATDDKIIEALRKRAIAQDNYVSLPDGGSLTIEDGPNTDDYPPNSDLETVFFVDVAEGPLGKGDITYKADTNNADGYGKGTLVVVNGDLTTNSSADPFEGAFVVRDPDDADSWDMEYKNSGSMELKGYANVEGNMTLSGDTTGSLVGGLAGGIPGLYDTVLWSWRECYNETCS